MAMPPIEQPRDVTIDSPAEGAVTLPSFRRSSQLEGETQRLRPLKASSQHTFPNNVSKTGAFAQQIKESTPKVVKGRKLSKKALLQVSPTLAAIVPKDQLQERRRQKKWLMQVRRIRLLIRLLFSIALLAGLVALLGWMWQPIIGPIVWESPPQLISPNLLEKTLEQQAVGASVWLVNPRQLEADLVATSPLIASAAVRRQGFPTRLVVSVVEHTPWAVWYEGSNAPPSKKPLPSKREIPNADPVFSSTKPVLRGLVLPSQQWVAVSASQPSVASYIQHPQYPLMPVVGNSQHRPTPEQWQQLQQLTQLLATLPELHVQALDVQQLGNVRVVCDGPDVFVGPLNSTWQQRFQRISGVLPHLAQWAPVIEAVDLRWEQQVTLHKKGKGRLLTSTSDNAGSQFHRP